MRTRIVTLTALLTLALTTQASAAVTSTLSGTTAALLGDGTVTITQSGANLAHDRFAAGDAGFDSATDWDTSVAGTQPLVAATTSSVDATGGAIPVVVDDSASSTARTVVGGAVSGLVSVTAIRLTVRTGSGADDVSYPFGASPRFLTAETNGGDDTISFVTCQSTDYDVTATGGPGTDTLVLNHQGTDGTLTSTSFGASCVGPYAKFHSGIEEYEVRTFGFANSSVTVATTGGERTDVTGADGSNTLALADGASLNGGSFDGNGGTDTLTYAAYTTAATVDLLAGTATGTGSVADVENVTGGSGGDTLDGDGGPNILAGGGGVDDLDGRGGADRLRNGSGNGTLDGGDGSDVSDDVGADHVALDSAGGRTRLTTTNVDATLTLGTIEQIDFSANGLSVQYDLPGVTQLNGSVGGAPIVVTGSAADETYSLNVAPSAMQLQRTGGPDMLILGLSGASPPTIDAGGGNDTITTTSGTNTQLTLRGGTGTDTLTGGSVGETLEGGAGSDTLRGGGGGDTLTGGDDDDTLRGGAGDDTLSGGAGIDVADFADAPGPVSFDVGSGQAAAVGVDTLTSIEGAVGGSFADVITGDGGANRLIGGPGPDVLEGNGGADTLTGDTGNDRLTGGTGADSATGGAGDDRIELRDNAAVDTAACGADFDRVEVDTGETAGGDCELVEAPSGPGPQGPQGPAGTTGGQGPAGTDGSNGANGAQGPAGPTGATGQSGATGQAGATGPAGPQGPRGATGPAGRDARVTCTPSKPKKGQVKVTCKVTLVAGKGSSVRARLERGGRTYASGVPTRRNGRLSLRFVSKKKLKPGRYTLVVNERTGNERTVTRLTVAL
jgi:RTX calcium-binding nonapeptide repeat (4 copies)